MFIGLDLGTSGVRALVVDGSGQPVASSEAPVVTSHPHPGWSEQTPADWIKATRVALDGLPQDVRAQVQGLGMAGHMHGAVMLDASDQPVYPCIMWNDTRSHSQAAQMDAIPAFRELSGNIVFPGFTAPKLKWLADTNPTVFDRVSRVLLPKDYLTLWLTGECVTDLSDAAGTAWLDTGGQDWSDTLLGLSGMRRDQMPKLQTGTSVIGQLRPSVAAQLGLPGKVRVVAGGADNAAAACGVGALEAGQGFVSLGTSGVLLVASANYAPNADTAVHTFCHAVPDRWYQMGVILSATDSLSWLGRVTGASPAELTRALGDDLRPPGRAQFLPYLSGERTPHNDADTRGAFLNLDVAQDRSDVTCAVLEGVAFALRDSLQALNATGNRPERLLAIGGGAQSLYWVRVLATVLDLPLDLPSGSELGAAMGAARMAICGVTGAAPTDVMTRPPVARTVDPDAALTAAFDKAYARFSAAYPAVRGLS